VVALARRLPRQPGQPPTALEGLQCPLDRALGDPKDRGDPRRRDPPAGHTLPGLVAHAAQQHAAGRGDEPRLPLLGQPYQEAAGHRHPAQPWRELRPQGLVAVLAQGLPQGLRLRQELDDLRRPRQQPQRFELLQPGGHRRQARRPQQAAQLLGVVVHRGIWGCTAAFFHQF